MKRKLTLLLSKIYRTISSPSTFLDAKDISLGRQLRARESTVRYINDNMSEVQSVRSKWAVHDIGLGKCLAEGEFLEFGVFTGETINYIASKVPKSKVVSGFDSFEGLPELWRDGFEEGAFKLKSLPKVRSNVTLYKGWFEEGISNYLANNSIEYISYLHIDCDLYSSTKTIFEKLGKYIKTGSIIVFDEYFNFPGWEGDEFKAFQEFINETGLMYEYLTYNSRHEQVAIKIIGNE
ncbi:class I SAM-dependent methyltransferase [Schleiferiaceae bacterium]|nr:class I SAM-dependent methyltransferase [Schleiferiaceae bacterium]